MYDEVFVKMLIKLIRLSNKTGGYTLPIIGLPYKISFESVQQFGR
jgi:hypothetical protein